MKILYFLDDGKLLGGAAVTLIRQAFLAMTAGYEVIIYLSDYEATSYDIRYMDYLKKHHFIIKMLPFRITSTPENVDVICIDETYEIIKNEIKRQDPDLLHSLQLNVAVELVSRELSIPHIMNIYPLMKDFFSYRYLEVFPHYHVCDSEYWAKAWHHYWKTEYCCIRTYAKEGVISAKTDSKCVQFLCVGAIYAEKNQLGVIKAFHYALEEYKMNAELHLLGSEGDKYCAICKEYVDENKLRNKVIFHGFQSNMEMYYQKADVLVCGSLRESYPNAISEALANNLMIVTTPVGGIPEVIKDGYNGLVTDDYSIDSIAEKIEQAYRLFSGNKQDAMIKNVRCTYIEQHSAECVWEKLKSFYDKIRKQEILHTDCDIQKVRREYSPYIELYKKNKLFFSNSQEIAEKIWLLFYISENLKQEASKRKIFIWGVGHYGLNTLEIMQVFFSEIKIAGFIDSCKIGKFKDYDIYTPGEVMAKRECILLSFINGQNEVVSMLAEKKYVLNKDYFIMAPRKW